MNKLNESLDYYLELGEKGFFPLFYKEWIIEAELFQKQKKIPGKRKLSKKKLNLEFFFKKMSEHKNMDRKKLMISAMPKDDRDHLIAEFFSKLDSRLKKNQYNSH